MNKGDDVNAGNLNLSRIKGTGNNAFILYIENNIDYCLEQFSDTVNDEEEDSLLFILNNENIDEEDKINYLTNQRNRIENIEDITESFRDMAVKLFLVKPTWENVASYFCSSGKSVPENLISYIEHYGDDLGYLECVDSIEVKYLLFNLLLVSNKLNIDTFKKLFNSFDNTINDGDSLSNLEPRRVDFLIDRNKIEYTNENTLALFSYKVPIMAKYLISHKNDFLQEVETFKYTANLAICLLKSSAFAIHEKSQIVSALNLDTIKDNSDLATEICSLLTKVRIDLNENVLKTILRISHNINDRVAVVTYVIENCSDDMDLIESLLCQLPSPYADIAKHDQKHPILENTSYNSKLLEVLKNVSYISTVSETDKGLKVNKRML